MNTRIRRAFSAAAAASMVLLGGASMAWACSAQAGITGSGVQGQSSGAPGSRVDVNVSKFPPDPIEVRWNSSTGEVLATGRGPDFVANVTIPQVPDGVYYIVATGGQTGREQKASMSFEVISNAAQQSGANNSSDQSSGGTGQTSSSTAGGDDEQKTGPQTSPSSGSTSSGSGTQAGSGGQVSTAPTSGGGGAVSSGPASAEGAPATASAPRSATPGAPTATPSPAPAGGVVTQARADAGSPSVESSEGTAAVSSSSVSSDLWSGFSGSDATDRGNATLNDDTPSSQSIPAPVIAVGVFSAALLAMLGGFGVSETRRRRAIAV